MKATGPDDWNRLLLESGTLPALRRRERALSRRRGLIYEDGSAVRVIDLQLRPRLMSKAQLAHLARLARAVRAVQAWAARAWLDDAQLRATLPLEPAEEAVWRAAAKPAAFAAPVVSRLDASLPIAADWRRRLKLFEVNSVGVGGLLLIPIGESVVADVVVPRLRIRGARPCPDTRERLIELLAGHARRLGARRPAIGLVEDRSEPGGTVEYDWLVRLMRARGVDVVLGDPRELAQRGGCLTLRGRAVDVLYRDVELADLDALRGPPAMMPAFTAAFAQGRIVSGLAGDLDHKSLWELMTEPSLARRIPQAARRALAPHALWTRLFFPRRTSDPRGRVVDLAREIRSGRERYVLKPNRSYGGRGVTVGVDATAAQWDGALDRATREPGRWVVQALGEVVREPFPREIRGRWTLEDLFVDCGLFLVGDAVGVLSRAARKRVVNVASGGGLAAMLIR